jgi:general nucleoside transport system permease protein
VTATPETTAPPDAPPPATGTPSRRKGPGSQLRSLLFGLAVSLGAAGLALLVSFGIIAVTGGDPQAAARALWDGAFGSRAQVAGTLSEMIPLVLVALGWIVAFSARRVNIGFEGQILVGGVFATWVALKLSLPYPWHLALAVVAGVIGGALYVGIAAWLWAKRSVNEIIATLMLNFIAIQLVSWLVRGPFQEATRTFPRSAAIPPSARWPKLLSHTPLAWDLFVAVGMVAVIWFVLNRTSFGFSVRLTGANAEAARHAGVSTTSVTVAALLISGALAGLTGASLILGGESTSMTDNFSAGYGFTGIVVALLARNSPWGTIPAALLFAALRQGGGLMEARVGISSALVLITQGLVIVFVAGSQFLFEGRRAARVDAREVRVGASSRAAARAGG